MISTLCIKNVGIIDEITLNLNEGLNILTGETGARENTYNWCTWKYSSLKRNFLKSVETLAKLMEDLHQSVNLKTSWKIL